MKQCYSWHSRFSFTTLLGYGCIWQMANVFRTRKFAKLGESAEGVVERHLEQKRFICWIPGEIMTVLCLSEMSNVKVKSYECTSAVCMERCILCPLCLRPACASSPSLMCWLTLTSPDAKVYKLLYFKYGNGNFELM